jgi:hypothetical protein
MKCPCCGHEWEHKSYTAKLLELLPTTRENALSVEEIAVQLWGSDWSKTRKRKSVTVYLFYARKFFYDTWRIYSYEDRRYKEKTGGYPHRFWKEKINVSDAS